jgi:hypothetical protein
MCIIETLQDKGEGFLGLLFSMDDLVMSVPSFLMFDIHVMTDVATCAYVGTVIERRQG